MDCISKTETFDKPTLIICNTIKGKDVPFAEWDPVWHYKSLNDELFKQAMAYLDNLKKSN
jgi:transketolase